MPTVIGASPIRASPNNTGSMSAPSWRRPCCGSGSPAARAARWRPRACSPRGACWARSRNISSSSSCRATPSSLPARCCDSRACARPTPSSPGRMRPSPRCRPMTAASSRSPPISPNACARCSPIRQAGRGCRPRSPTGCACRPKSRSCRPRRDPGRDLPARPQALSRLLSLRGAACPSEPRHAAHPQAGAGAGAAARLRRQ